MENHKKKKQKNILFSNLPNTLIWFLMFLGSMCFITRDYYCFFLAFALFLFTPGRKITASSSFVFLLLFSVSILFFNPQSHGMFTNMIKPFAYPVCFLMGRNLFVSSKTKGIDLDLAERNTKAAIYVVALGTLIHYVLNWIANMGAETRNDVIDFWSQETVSATSQATLACIMIGVVAATFFSDEATWKKIFALVALIFIIAYNLALAGRTLFALLLITLSIAFVFGSLARKRKMFRTIFLTALVITLLLLLYHFDAFGMKSWFESSNFYERFFGNTAQALDDDERSLHKLAYLERFWQYPFGGGNIRAEYGHSAHDLYLDTYDESGIFAFVFIVIYILASFSRMLQVVKNKSISFNTKQLIFCCYTVVNIQFWLEPIIRGMPWLLSSYCFIDGAVSCLLQEAKKMKK